MQWQVLSRLDFHRKNTLVQMLWSMPYKLAVHFKANVISNRRKWMSDVHNDKEVTSLTWCIICWFRITYNLWLSGGQKELVKKVQIKSWRLDFAFIRLDEKEISLFYQNRDIFFMWDSQMKYFLLGVLSIFYLNLITLVRDLPTKYNPWSSFGRRKGQVFKSTSKPLKSYKLIEIFLKSAVLIHPAL